MNSYEAAANVSSKDEFLIFVAQFLQAYRQRPDSDPAVGNYIESMSAWVEDMEGFYLNVGLPMPSLVGEGWRLLASVIAAGTIYE